VTPTARRAPGRIRSTTSRLAILQATLKLLETQPLQQISIEAIAREAGVGKATIYRWWPSKAAVVIEAFLVNHVSHVVPPKGVKPSQALAEVLRLLIKEYEGRAGRIVAQIIAEGQSDPEVLKEWRERFWLDRRTMALELVNEARRVGEFRDDIPVDIQLDQLFAPIYFQLLTGHAPLDQAFASTYCDSIMRLMAPDARQTPTKQKSR
jgi:AcrR family transcriptional regulator